LGGVNTPVVGSSRGHGSGGVDLMRVELIVEVAFKTLGERLLSRPGQAGIRNGATTTGAIHPQRDRPVGVAGRALFKGRATVPQVGERGRTGGVDQAVDEW
jgi:hypothetical protein